MSVGWVDSYARRTVKVHWPDIEVWAAVVERCVANFEEWRNAGYGQAIITYAGSCRVAVVPL